MAFKIYKEKEKEKSSTEFRIIESDGTILLQATKTEKYDRFFNLVSVSENGIEIYGNLPEDLGIAQDMEGRTVIL